MRLLHYFDLPLDCPLDGFHPVGSSSSLFDGDETDFGPLLVHESAFLFEHCIFWLSKPLHRRLHDEVFEFGLEEHLVIRASEIFIFFARLWFLELQAQGSSQIYLVCNLWYRLQVKSQTISDVTCKSRCCVQETWSEVVVLLEFTVDVLGQEFCWQNRINAVFAFDS